MTTVNQESRSKNSCSFLFPLSLLFKQKTGRKNNRKRSFFHSLLPLTSQNEKNKKMKWSSLHFLTLSFFRKKRRTKWTRKWLCSFSRSFHLVPSPCFHFLKKEGGNEREKEDDFILIFRSPPLPKKEKMWKRKRKRRNSIPHSPCFSLSKRRKADD